MFHDISQDGLIVLLNTIHGMQEAGGSTLAKGDEDTINDQYEQTEEVSHLESGVSIATMMSEVKGFSYFPRA